jgi:methylmalonyl-CoA mutase cobalamin-binding domain/chain
MDILNEISLNLQRGKEKDVKNLVQKAIAENIDAETILEKGLIAGMVIIGDKFKNDEIYVPDVLIAAKAMNAGSLLLKPLLVSSGVKAKGKVVLGTAKGDLHDIGKNLVKMMMEGRGLEVIDLGVNISAEKFISTAIENDAKVVACSALLTTTMIEMENLVKKAVFAGIRDDILIMVGGAPITDEFCKNIGADIYKPDAASAADAAYDFYVK